MNDHPFNILKYIDQFALISAICFSVIYVALSILHHKYKERLSEKDIGGIIQIRNVMLFCIGYVIFAFLNGRYGI